MDRVVMRSVWCFLALATALLAVPPSQADQILGPGRIDGSGKVVLPGGPTLGTFSNGKYTATPDATTGDLSGGSVVLPSGPLLPAGKRGLPDTLTALQGVMQRVFRFDPRAYGASCNGSGIGDDSGLNSAIAALQFFGGGALLVPGQCVVSTGKIVSGVPVAVVGDGFGGGQLIASSSFAPTGGFLLRLDITNSSNYTAKVAGVGFRTYQKEAIGALQIEGSPSGLEERVTISDVEIRGADIGQHGFSYGMQLKNVNGPRVNRATITGRQTGNGPTGLTFQTACIDIPKTAGAATNYAFSDVRCNAAQIGWNMNGYLEGVMCTRCVAVAVGNGFKARPGAIVPWLSISQSHIDFFNAGMDVEQFAQSMMTANLLYHRSDSTANGIC